MNHKLRNILPKGRLWSGSLDDIRDLLLFEDNHLLVLFKPPTFLTQADEKNGCDNLLHALKRYLVNAYRKPGDAYLGMIQRIDRPCSGIIVFAKTSKSAARLSENLRKNEFVKNYLCIVNGKPIPEHSNCTNYIINQNDIKVKVFDVDGSNRQFLSSKTPSILNYRTMETLHYNYVTKENSLYSLLDISLVTGRKHQIRAQLSYNGNPIYGDTKYLAPQFIKERMLPLHAYHVSFPHPISKEKMNFTCSPPHFWELYFGPSLTDTIDKLILERS